MWGIAVFCILKEGEVRFLICTDVAARGIDITGVPYGKSWLRTLFYLPINTSATVKFHPWRPKSSPSSREKLRHESLEEHLLVLQNSLCAVSSDAKDWPWVSEVSAQRLINYLDKTWLPLRRSKCDLLIQCKRIQTQTLLPWIRAEFFEAWFASVKSYSKKEQQLSANELTINFSLSLTSSAV